MDFAITLSDTDAGFVKWLNEQNANTIKEILLSEYLASNEIITDKCDVSATIEPNPTFRSERSLSTKEGNACPQISSYAKGKAAEAKMVELLSRHFAITPTGKMARSGDIIVEHNGKKILIEVKDLAVSVGAASLEKFERDIDLNAGINGALLISLGSAITGHEPVSIVRDEIVKVFLTKPSDDLIVSMVKFACIVGTRTAKDISLIENFLEVIVKMRKDIDKFKSSNNRKLDSWNNTLQLSECKFRRFIAEFD